MSQPSPLTHSYIPFLDRTYHQFYITQPLNTLQSPSSAGSGLIYLPTSESSVTNLDNYTMKTTTFSIILTLGSSLISSIPLYHDSSSDLTERDFTNVDSWDVFERDLEYDLDQRNVDWNDLFEREIDSYDLSERDLTSLEPDLYERDNDSRDLLERFADDRDILESSIHDPLRGRADKSSSKSTPKPAMKGQGQGAGGADIGNALATLFIGLEKEPKVSFH